MKIDKCLITGENNVSKYGEIPDSITVVSEISNLRYRVSGSFLVGLEHGTESIGAITERAIRQFSESNNNELADFPCMVSGGLVLND